MTRVHPSGGLRRSLAAAALILMATTGCAGADRAGPRQEPTPDDTLDTAITGAMDTAEIPGAIVGVWSPEREYVRAFGIADTTTGTPMKTDFFHRIGSVTKTFTATAVLQLAGDGRFGLDYPIGRYVDGVPGGESITVRQLAGMRSGLADYTRSDGFQAAVAANPRADFTPRQLLDWAFAEMGDFKAEVEAVRSERSGCVYARTQSARTLAHAGTRACTLAHACTSWHTLCLHAPHAGLVGVEDEFDQLFDLKYWKIREKKVNFKIK